MTALTERRMIRAMRENDAAFNGSFYVGVHSTRIYCLPSCTAKLPKLENVVFYPTREEAIAAGLRGCKRCKSERYPDTLPDWYKQALSHLRANLDEKLDERALMKLTGVEITTLRRFFIKRLGATPLAFHRRLRLKHAHALLLTGADYIEAGLASGWESPSGFREAFVKQFGYPPGAAIKQER
ncbi:MAG TPA: Ada metal-binding domain-containing protein [candidate division Zixibacteria bacterium]|nr:Ada metal-binding domain-containing protein [candidate division Zixibacteria bacterium]